MRAYGGLFTSQCSTISPPFSHGTGALHLEAWLWLGLSPPSNASAIPPSPCILCGWRKGVLASFLSSLISGCYVMVVPGHMLLPLVLTTGCPWRCRTAAAPHLFLWLDYFFLWGFSLPGGSLGGFGSFLPSSWTRAHTVVFRLFLGGLHCYCNCGRPLGMCGGVVNAIHDYVSLVL